MHSVCVSDCVRPCAGVCVLECVCVSVQMFLCMIMFCIQSVLWPMLCLLLSVQSICSLSLKPTRSMRVICQVKYCSLLLLHPSSCLTALLCLDNILATFIKPIFNCGFFSGFEYGYCSSEWVKFSCNVGNMVEFLPSPIEFGFFLSEYTLYIFIVW